MGSGNTKAFDVFLSHAHLDAGLVEVLAQKLEDEAGFTVWLDKWILVPGKHWQQEMAKGLNQAKTCAVFIGKSTPRGWFHEEIQRALNRQTKDQSFRVIPVILPGGDNSLVDDFLELRTWVEFQHNVHERDAFHLLSCGVKGVSPGRLRKENIGNEQNINTKLTHVRSKLIHIRSLQSESLIDNDVALEYQRRLLDLLMDSEL